MHRQMSISHKLHPARREGKTLAGLAVIRFALASGKSLMIGSSKVDELYRQIKFLYPEANIKKLPNGVLIENEKS